MPHGRLWEIVREHSFEDELHDIEEDAERADAFVEGAEFILARDPESGFRIANSNVWILPTAEANALTPLVIYYTFDETRVYLLSIQRTNYPPVDE